MATWMGGEEWKLILDQKRLGQVVGGRDMHCLYRVVDNDHASAGV